MVLTNFTNFTIAFNNAISEEEKSRIFIDSAKQFCKDKTYNLPLTFLIIAICIEIIEPYVLTYILKHKKTYWKWKIFYFDNTSIFQMISILKTGLVFFAIIFMFFGLNLYG